MSPQPLDGQLEAKVLDGLFKDMDENTVVIMATHKSRALKNIDRVIVMEAGRLAIDGPKDKVLKRLTAKARLGGQSEITEIFPVKQPGVMATSGLIQS